MLKPSLNELKQIVEMRGIRSYKIMSDERLISSIDESESVKESGKNFHDAKIEKIKMISINLAIHFLSQK